jgi:hypothetical protein
VLTATVPSTDEPQLVLQRGSEAAEGKARAILEFRMCPFCRGTLKLIRAGGPLMASTYQCLDCREITTAESEAGKDSYFEWLMSRTKSKVLRARPA